MADRVQIKSQGWGVIQDTAGNAVSSMTLDIETSPGVNATVYLADTGATTTSPTSNADGEVAGWLEPGTYLVTDPRDLEVRTVEAVTGIANADVSVTLEAPINVQHSAYGAVGDGSTDDTAAIQAAIDAASAADGGEVFFPFTGDPNGGPSYLITAQLDGASDVILRGEGRNKTAIEYAGAGALSMLKFTAEANFAIRDLRFHMPSSNVAVNAIHLVDCVAWDIEDVQVSGGTAITDGNNKLKGIYCQQTASGLVPDRGFGRISNYNYIVEPPHPHAGTVSAGIYLEGHASQRMRNISIEGWGNIEHAEHGIKLVNCDHSKIGGTYFLQGNDKNLTLDGASWNVIDRLQMASPGTEHANVDSDSYGNVFILPSFYNPLTFGTQDGVYTTIIGSAEQATVQTRLSNVELVYSEQTTDVTVSATTEASPTTVIDNSTAITLDGNTTVLVEFYAAGVDNPGNAGGNTVTLSLWDGTSTNLGRLGEIYHDSTLYRRLPVLIRRRFTPAAGTYTYKVRGYRSNANGTVKAGSGGSGGYMPAYLRVSTL